MPSEENRRVIHETDSTGQAQATYVLSTTTISKEAKDSSGSPTRSSTRLDVLPTGHRQSSLKSSLQSSRGTVPPVTLLGRLRSSLTSLQLYLITLFLPTGYPHSVTPDYTPYQVYDSLQAFASTIAGLLSSRAVLQSFNLASSASSDAETATYATLLSIAQSTIGNVSTILFAQYAAPRISAEVKFYRFLADVVNDLAFVLDCLSPTLPPMLSFSPGLLLGFDFLPSITLPVRILTLCLSSALRAICGVAGGSSKAVLSSHFAKDDPSSIGELNAKDGSQETVVNLVGMWIGGVLVSRVTGMQATWIWMLCLLGMHLWFNYCAVRSVKLRALNKTRAAMVLSRLVMRNDSTKGGPDLIDYFAIGSTEAVLFGRKDVLLYNAGTGSFGTCHIGASFTNFTRTPADIQSCSNDRSILPQILDCFEHEQYLLWYNTSNASASIVLKRNASSEDQLKSQYQSIIVAQMCSAHKVDSRDMVKMLTKSLEYVNANWQKCCSELREAGWDLDSTVLENPPGNRIDIEA